MRGSRFLLSVMEIRFMILSVFNEAYLNLEMYKS